MAEFTYASAGVDIDNAVRREMARSLNERCTRSQLDRRFRHAFDGHFPTTASVPSSKAKSLPKQWPLHTAATNQFATTWSTT